MGGWRRFRLEVVSGYLFSYFSRLSQATMIIIVEDILTDEDKAVDTQTLTPATKTDEQMK